MQNNKQLLSLSKNFLDIDTLIKIYYTHSHLSYGLIVWGSMLNAKSREELFKIQKACVRLINKRMKNSPTNSLFKKNRILKFADKFGYRLSKQSLPMPIEATMNKKGGRKTHQYPTHNKLIPNIQKHSCKQFNNSYLCKGVSLLSDSKDCIKGTKSL